MDLDSDGFSTSSEDSDKVNSDLESELYSAFHYNDFSNGIPESVQDKYRISFNSDKEVNISLKPANESQCQSQIEQNFIETSPEVISLSSDSESIIVMNGKKKEAYSDSDSDIIIMSPKELDTISLSSQSDVDLMLNTSAPARMTTTHLEVSDIINTRYDWLKVSSPKTWTLKMREYYNKPNLELRHFDHIKIRNEIKNGEGASWTINNADRGLTPLRRPKRCMVCNQTDHLMKACRKLEEKNCSMCGGIGHYSGNCPQRICLNCGEKNACFMSKCEKCVQDSSNLCSNCNLVGHNSYNCPDTWRKFHSTIGPNSDVNSRSEPNSKVYCSNCARPGHFYENCRFGYESDYPLTSSFVQNYSESINHVPRRQRFSEPSRGSNFQTARKRKRHQNQFSFEFPKKTKSRKKYRKNKRFKMGNPNQ